MGLLGKLQTQGVTLNGLNGTVYIDSTKAGTAFAVGTSKLQ